MIATTSGRSAFTRSTTRRRKSTPSRSPMCRSLICTMRNPSIPGASRASGTRIRLSTSRARAVQIANGTRSAVPRAMVTAWTRACPNRAAAAGQPCSRSKSSRPRSVTTVVVSSTPEAPSQAIARGGKTRLGQPRSRRLNTKPTGTATTRSARSAQPPTVSASERRGSTNSRRATYTWRSANTAMAVRRGTRKPDRRGALIQWSGGLTSTAALRMRTGRLPSKSTVGKEPFPRLEAIGGDGGRLQSTAAVSRRR